MNILKSGKKQSRKEALVEESNVGLPDVVAGLSLGDTYIIESNSYACDSVSMHNSNNQMEDSMIEYSSHFTPIAETTAFRRVPQQPTPQGLGAGPMVLDNSPEANENAFDNCGYSKRLDPGISWRQSDQWSQCQLTANMKATQWQTRQENGTMAMSDSENFRIRSISSEPRGQRESSDDRRSRCSSANRNRQLRQRSQINTLPFQSNPFCQPIASPPISPPLSPPVQRRQYQCSATSTTSNNGSALLQPQPLSPLLHRNDNQQREASNDRIGASSAAAIVNGPGGSYGYQVADLDALLTQASPTRPANLPMVLACPTKLHNMRMTNGNQNQQTARSYLPLGIIVNAVFKTRDWLYVRTAHGAEGYVPYRVCLPLGILPLNRSSIQQESNMSAAGVSWEPPTNNSNNPTTPYRARVSGGKIFSPSLDPSHRSRPRSRRRHMANSMELANQTDSQKLQPSTPTANGTGDMRENFQSIAFTPHIV